MPNHLNNRGFYRPDQYFGAWAILPDRFSKYWGIVQKLDIAKLAADAAAKAATEDATEQARQNKIALMKDALAEKGLALSVLDEQIVQDAAAIKQIEAENPNTPADVKDFIKELDAKKDKRVSFAEEFETLKAQIESELKQDGDLPSEQAKAKPYQMRNGTAMIYMNGPMTKYPSSFQSLFGGCSTIVTQNLIRRAVADDEVKRICLCVDSPGGSVSGTWELSEEIRKCIKPCWVFCDDTCCSAAYFASAGAKFIACNRTAIVGSIGTLIVLEDTSGMYAKEGVKVHVVGTGKYKGAGTDGAPVTDEQKEYFQGIVDETNRHFIAAVTEGRKMSAEKLNTIKEAGVFIGQQAVEMGLVDEVMSFEDFITKFETETSEASMDQKSLDERYAAGQADTRKMYADILAACDNNAKIAGEYFTAGKTLDQAKEAYAGQLKAELALAQATKVSAEDGQKPVQIGTVTQETAENAFLAHVSEEIKKTRCDRREAISRVIKAHPALYEQWQESFQAVKRIEETEAKEKKE